MNVMDTVRAISPKFMRLIGLACLALAVVFFMALRHPQQGPRLSDLQPAVNPFANLKRPEPMKPKQLPAARPQVVEMSQPTPQPAPACNPACRKQEQREARYEAAIHDGFGTAEGVRRPFSTPQEIAGSAPRVQPYDLAGNGSNLTTLRLEPLHP